MSNTYCPTLGCLTQSFSPSLPLTRPSLPRGPPLALPPGHLPTLAAPTRQHIPWQPAPGHPLEPAPLSIRESWDPTFRQPPMSKLGKYPSNASQPSSLVSLAKSRTLSGRWKRSKKQGLRPKPTLRTSLKPSILSRMGLEASNSTGPGPRRHQAPAVEATPRPISKVDPIGSTSRVSFWPKPSKGLPVFAQPTPVRAVPPRVPSPPPSPRLRSPIGTAAPPPPAPVAAYPAPVKVDHPDAYTGKIGSEAKQWLTQMLAWTRLNSRMFPTNQEVLSFLLMNMKDSAGAWAHPHLDQLGSHRAIIQTVEGFKIEFLAAFGDPDATRAAKRKITTLTQSGTCADYITKFRTLAWNWTGTTRPSEASLPRPPLEVSRQITTREHRPEPSSSCRMQHLSSTTLSERSVLAIRRRIVSLADHQTPQGGRVPAKSTGSKKLSDNPNFVSEEERNRRRAAGACIKCGKMGHKFAECRTGWKATLLRTRGRQKKPPKLAKTLSTNREKNSPFTPYRYYAQWVKPQAGKIWKKANLTFSFDGKRMTETFLICNTGLIGICCTLSFPHTPPEQVAIAEEEEADKKPLEGVPPSTINTPIRYTQGLAQDELKAGKIRPSKSSISSPVMFVPKKDGSRRLVVDYRRLNNRTKKNVYPLPRPDDLMAQLRGAKEGNEWKTAFRTKYGLYKSLVMTFGLTNAPAAFQHFMNELFKDLLDVCVIIYLDDILIYSKDNASHTKHVHKVLRRLMENQLFCKASKCTFTLDKLKIQAVQEWPVPTKVKEVQLFLGFANFLRRFVANFSHMARPLHNLKPTRQEQPLDPYLVNGRKTAAYIPSASYPSHSRELSRTMITHDKELLAIICSFEYWRIFLEGTAYPITVFTDHRNLEYWKESRTFNRRHARWHLLLAGYNFQIVYRPGKQSGKPDALSRRSDHADIPPDAQTMLPDPVFANVALVTPEKELQRQIELSLDQDESLEEILQFLQNESKAPPSIKRAFKDYEMEAGLLFYQGRIVVPDVGTLRTDLLRIFHDSPLAGHPVDNKP
ncbi:hypothetical protein RHS01_06510 [Rhizoctonia solani]|uniref:CCHC-type domain-containing protein n=1 Tax=Rhizoctonia solani TaxID=456999 RepID=A0A8H7ICD8_9AGAM|nr:hypothetical protein RHS01_06510 [Rhizoctonia solani]